MTSYQNRSKKTDKKFQGRIRISTKLKNLTLFFFFSIKLKLSRHTERIEFFFPLQLILTLETHLRDSAFFPRALPTSHGLSLSLSLSLSLPLSLAFRFFFRSHPRAITLSPSRYLAPLTLALSLRRRFRRHAATERVLA